MGLGLASIFVEDQPALGSGDVVNIRRSSIHSKAFYLKSNIGRVDLEELNHVFDSIGHLRSEESCRRSVLLV